MLNKIKRRLLWINILAFTGVLSAFGAVVFGYFVESIDFHIREGISTMVNTAIATIDADDIDGIPDALKDSKFVSNLGPVSAELQWFNNTGRMVIERGPFSADVPFAATPEFAEHPKPHAVIVTRPAYAANGQIIGYMRGIQSLEARDRDVQQLLTGLCCGVVCGGIASALGIHFLLAQSMEPMTDMVRRLRQFTADASHELISPVTAIKSNASVALKYSDGMRESDKEKMESIYSAAQQMSMLIESLLHLARADEHREDPIRHELPLIEVKQMCESIVAENRQLKDGVAVEMSIPSGVHVRGLSMELQSMYGNIIRNAFQYTPQGGHIKIVGLVEDGSIRVAVTDNGPGIDARDLPHIFDRFWRADRTRSSRTGGAGLGLSIAKTIADKYGGTIEVASEPGRGTTFEVTLPAVIKKPATVPAG